MFASGMVAKRWSQIILDTHALGSEDDRFDLVSVPIFDSAKSLENACCNQKTHPEFSKYHKLPRQVKRKVML